jgi:hypothetical protein
VMETIHEVSGKIAGEYVIPLASDSDSMKRLDAILRIDAGNGHSLHYRVTLREGSAETQSLSTATRMYDMGKFDIYSWSKEYARGV